MKKSILFLLLSASAFLCGESVPEKANPAPWLTGPLIAPVGTAVPYGDFLVKSYVFLTAKTGVYKRNWEAVSSQNIYNLNTQFLCFFGLTPWCDLNVIPQFSCNFYSNRRSIHCGDLTVGLDFQLLGADATFYFPGIKFAVREVFPTGNFQFLQPAKLRIDASGQGTFATQFDLVFYKLFQLSTRHWLSTTVSAQYTVNSPVNVHGFNVYGGGFGADGKALPGNEFQGIVSFELTLSKNWVFAIDQVYKYTDPTPFYGLPGVAFTGDLAKAGKPTSCQLSFAPAIEYNFSSQFGIIGGLWFTALGKNSTQFQSGVVNVEYTY